MLDLNKLLQIEEIIVHDNCADGTTSAMILSLALPQAKVTFCQYETELHKTLPAKPGMLFCDFSPHLSRVQEFLDVEAIVLDHHGGPAGEVTRMCEAKGLGRYGHEPGVSGAVLAYREVFLPLYETGKVDLTTEQAAYVKEFAETIGIYDTWQRKDERWEKACHYTETVKFYPWKYLHKTLPSEWYQFVKLGPILLDKRSESTEKAYSTVFRFTTGKGTKVAVFQGGSKHTSALADRMGTEIDCLLGFNYLVEDGFRKVVFSSRSRGAFSCRNLALAFGGGGHTNAAGFSIPVEDEDLNPYLFSVELMRLYETVSDKWTEEVAKPDFDARVVAKDIVPKELFESLRVAALASAVDSLMNLADCGSNCHSHCSQIQVKEEDPGV